MENRIIGIDPSSTAIGWAILNPKNKSVLCADRIKPMAGVRKCSTITRIFNMVNQLKEIVSDGSHPGRYTQCIIEIPSGKVNLARHHGGGAGLSVYGMAVGVVWHMLYLNSTPIPVTEIEWTGGFSKEKRAAIAKKIYPQYDPAQDKGNDISDAIALALWWIEIGSKRKEIAHV